MCVWGGGGGGGGEGCVPYFRLEILESDILRGGPYLYGLGKVRFLLGRGGEGGLGLFVLSLLKF